MAKLEIHCGAYGNERLFSIFKTFFSLFAGLFLFPEGDGMNEKDQYFIRSLMANVLLKASAGSSKFSVSEIST